MLHVIFGVLKAALLGLWHILSAVVKLIYRMLKFLHIRILALYVLVCAVLSIFFPVFGTWLVYFWVGFALCAAVTAVSWVLAARKALNARPRTGAEEKTEKEAEDAPREEIAAAESPAPAPAPTPAPAPARYPRYFDVEGEPRYFFAEYEDRYELYRREKDGGYTYIRTDQKT